MLKGFRDFITRGNVIELAVAVVIGSAFTTIVNTVVTSIITPVVNAIGGTQVEGTVGFPIIAGREDTFVDLAAIINAVVVFLITAAVVYFIFVVPMNSFQERRKRGHEPEPEAPAEDVLLLQEIRDLLKAQSGRP
ncbi:large conductance mechanosensitive channel [Georgenia satyanarayanai]|uniref:Large-conductance mechanosensitive channel n=1 Tax=Georgenia satyanarayanai TaxID=860221 RepID=A0A2Y9A427_9MICO|nr:large conductance mechanosensitive channel protein MscL [Georgenia satyanarayanai]PYG00951.1 large conductance mechanosensitive channel [Georgenia satyanarayanai]SSA39190.1 large conductance mechanosensitive channel [Georgenia satyanarayanai]